MNGRVVMRPRATKAPPYFTPAPYKGLNTVAGTLANIGPEYALSLQNFICSGTGVDPRTGSREWATDLPGEVTSFLPYQSGGTAASKLFAVSGDSIYDVTSGGAVGAAVVTGLSASNAYWQSVSQTYGGATNNILIAVNGFNAPRIYNGSSWITCTQVGSPSSVGQFTTVDNNGSAVSISSFVDVCLHNQRVWFVANNTTKAYYLDIAAASGQLHAFDFGPFFPNGSSLFKLAAWTIDTGGGSGVQQLLVAISSAGDVVVYGGSNVAVSTSWNLVGTFKIGAPVGRRGTSNIGGDVLTLGQQGLLAISKLMQSVRVDATQAITYNISNIISDFVSTLSGFDGFEVIEYPSKDVIIVNIPQVNSASNFQFVYSTINGAWSQFTNWPARCFGLFNNSLYFGGNGKVYLAFIGFKDNADIYGVGGDAIIATGMQAYDQMANAGFAGFVGTQKHVKLVKPFLTTGDTAPTIRVGVNTDYNLIPIVGSATLNPATGGVWDSATWDDPGSTWVGSLTTYNQWVTPLCYPGTAFAFAISLSASAETSWQGTQWIVEPAGTFG